MSDWGIPMGKDGRALIRVVSPVEEPGKLDLYVGEQFVMRRPRDDHELTLVANAVTKGVAEAHPITVKERGGS